MRDQMNRGLKLYIIKDYFENAQLPKFDDKSILYISKDSSLWQYVFYNFFVLFLIKHYLIYFQSDQIILIELTKLGDLTKNIKKIPMEKISNIQFKRGIICSKLSFMVDNEKFQFKMPNYLLNEKWQEANLENIIGNYFLTAKT